MRPPLHIIEAYKLCEIERNELFNKMQMGCTTEHDLKVLDEKNAELSLIIEYMHQKYGYIK